jgi:hypothetical protein
MQSGNPRMSLIKLFLARITSALLGFSPDQERKIPGNPKIPEVHCSILGQKEVYISDNPGFTAGDGVTIQI